MAVVLVTMPFGSVRHPALGLSLLKAQLAAAGLVSSIEYRTFAFARAIGTEIYGRICEAKQSALVGEWIFAGELFPQRAELGREYLSRFFGDDPDFAETLSAIRSRVGRFLDDSADALLAKDPGVVGFTSTFQQHVASLALAARLKSRKPTLKILFGGANCEAEMGAETVRRFPFVDAAVSGEADLVIVELIGRLLDGESIDALPGVYTASNLERIAAARYPNAPSVKEMDRLPYPDFGEFFEALKAQPDPSAFEPRLLFESSRGCWWGEKHHCTFCGLNDATLTFRSKTPTRALDELTYLVERHDTRLVGAVDNILDVKYFKEFLPELARRELNLTLFYEVKANLKKAQLRSLRDAGVIQIQSGIESLSTAVLALMRKGTTGLQNVQTLKWCKEFGVYALWNVLTGFPGETTADYEAVAQLIPLISHLQPPDHAGKIRLDRFSPNYYDGERLGFTNVRPFAAYRFVYDLPAIALENLAYYFEYDYAEPRDVGAYTAPLLEAIDEWRAVHFDSELILIDQDDVVLIVDSRPKLGGRPTVLSGTQRILYLACDAIQGISQLQQTLASRGEALSKDAIEELLQPLIDAGLMLREGNAFLSLAIPLGEYVPRGALFSRLLDATNLVSAVA